ncbi:MAG: two-component sensor histidine kinase [Flavobacteriales bacterium]|nr:two-component sensor histidine kinase [Flavobacteriales bacterium]|tara:strand:+ start:13511 stop:14404 length:894 start_codon:yes stop_codon:yes gene_type:complete
MKRKHHILFIVLLVYVSLQSIWWLYKIYDLSAQSSVGTELNRKLTMILGEGAVFFVIILTGFLLTFRSFRKEIEVGNQQKNFLLAITHELKTPIASLKLYLQTLLKRQLDQPKQQDILEKSVKDADRLNGLVENILLATKIDDKGFPLNVEELNLSTMMEASTLHLLEVSGKQVDVEFFIQPDVKFRGDKDAFQSILNNLLSNALKYAPNQSTICVTLVQEGNETALSISDEGPGVANNEVDKIFEKFYRSGNEETRSQKGTGLGLYIVRKLVEQHNGIIQVKPNNKKGSIFVASFR